MVRPVSVVEEVVLGLVTLLSWAEDDSLGDRAAGLCVLMPPVITFTLGADLSATDTATFRAPLVELDEMLALAVEEGW